MLKLSRRGELIFSAIDLDIVDKKKAIRDFDWGHAQGTPYQK